MNTNYSEQADSPAQSATRDQYSCSRRTLVRLSGVTLTTASIAGCLGDSSQGTQTVEMTADLKFEPATVTVNSGNAVQWDNTSEIEHTVTAYAKRIPNAAAYFASGEFTSERAARQQLEEGLIEPGNQFKHTFSKSGTYEYFCIPHEGAGMTGTVQVND